MFTKNLNGLTGRKAMKFLGKDEILAAIKEHGQKAVSEALGMANSGVLSVALADLGWRESGPGRASNGNGKRSVKGALPVKTAIAVALVLGFSADEYDRVGWLEFLIALEIQGDAWLDLLETRLGGTDSEATADFRRWIDSNRAADLAAAERARREADPTFQLKVELRKYKTEAEDAKAKLAKAESDIRDLETMLRAARAATPKRTNGGTLTKEMWRLMVQRFHPDKQNGNDPILYNSIAQWINALETSD